MFEQVVFAGGGQRCWWQAGFWDVFTPATGLAPKVVGAVSAGAATACMLLANDSRNGLAYYRETLAGSPRNIYLGNLLRRGKRVFPHEAIYRRALHTLLGGSRFERLRGSGIDIRIACARPPEWMGPRSGVALGLLAYSLERSLVKPLHPGWCRRLGFTRHIGRVADCPDIESLVALILASSCTPPFTSLQYLDGEATLDGGLVDNVPVDVVAADRSTLVLTSRRYPGRAPIFMLGTRTYVQPSRPIPISRWDYTAPALYEAVYRFGRKDGERAVAAIGRGRFIPVVDRPVAA
ncbi:MAG: patatin-like phospholipase family protein [Burkholderiaceae bacterium]|nr:patatin-like phospholipase family protein [Burkholderiaceae bacterium]